MRPRTRSSRLPGIRQTVGDAGGGVWDNAAHLQEKPGVRQGDSPVAPCLPFDRA
jgi:hypothetical protein